MMTYGQQTCPMVTKGKSIEFKIQMLDYDLVGTIKFIEFQIKMLHSDWSTEKCFIVIGSPKYMHILSVYPWQQMIRAPAL